MNRGKKILKIVLIAAFCIIAVGGIIMLLWNWLVPPLFDGPEITFWQAVGLFLLSKIIFGGWRGGGWRAGNARWRHRYAEKLSTMSPEDRERFKQRMSEKWCHGSRPKTASDDSSNG